MLTGVVEVGLFCHMAKAAYFGNAVRPPPPPPPTLLPTRTFPLMIVVVPQDGSLTVRWSDGLLEHRAKGAKA